MCCYGGEQIRGTSRSLLVERAKLPVALGGYEGVFFCIVVDIFATRYSAQSHLPNKQKVHTHHREDNKRKEINVKKYEEWAKGLWRDLFG